MPMPPLHSSPFSCSGMVEIVWESNLSREEYEAGNISIYEGGRQCAVIEVLIGWTRISG